MSFIALKIGRKRHPRALWWLQPYPNQVKHVYCHSKHSFALLFSSSVGSLDINDIVWPGLALKPPEGLPERRFVRASFLEEDPYVMLSPPSACQASGGGGGQGGQGGKEGKEGKPKEARAGRSNQVSFMYQNVCYLFVWFKLKKTSYTILLKNEYV